jgi:nicotinamide-nucleotide amidase
VSSPGSRPTAAIVTVGSELTTGLRLDTNTREIAGTLTAAGMRVAETVSVADDLALIASVLARLCAETGVVVVTGGLGPTHDDVTREAAARALGLALHRDPALVPRLEASAARHADPEAAAQIVRQADILAGATVLPAVKGTAPGQLVTTQAGALLVLLPGPPSEMRPLLEAALPMLPRAQRGAARILSCAGVSESDVQVRVVRALGGAEDIGFTVLASLGQVSVVLTDEGGGAEALSAAASAAQLALGSVCFSADGLTLAEAVLARATVARVTLGTAESCTGGLVAAALTEVPGSSAAFVGGVVSYANDVKTGLLGVPEVTLAASGAVSEPVVRAMAEGARRSLGADLTVAVSGVAGPGGGSDAKPVGTVWFAVSDATGTHSETVRYPGDRAAVRMRSTARALDLLRLRLDGLL